MRYPIQYFLLALKVWHGAFQMCTYYFAGTDRNSPIAQAGARQEDLQPATSPCWIQSRP